MAHHILIPTDGSSLASRAVEQGLSLAHELAARATILTVIEPFRIFSMDPHQIALTQGEYEQAARDQAAACLKEAASRAQAVGVSCDVTQVEHDQPYQAIIDVALARGCDMIAMSSHGRSGLSAVILGSVTLKVLTHSKLPVIVFR